MKSKYIIPEVETIDLVSENRICTLSGNPNESFIEKPGGAFDI